MQLGLLSEECSSLVMICDEEDYAHCLLLDPLSPVHLAYVFEQQIECMRGAAGEGDMGVTANSTIMNLTLHLKSSG